MAKYIDRVALGNAMTIAAVNGKDRDRRIWAKAICLLHDMPPADVAPVAHGRWETNSDIPDSLICSICKCGFDMWKHDPHNYCSNCGAKMDERSINGEDE